MSARYWVVTVRGALLAMAASGGAAAEGIEEIRVVGTTPVQNAVGLDKDKLANNVQTATAQELEDSDSLDLASFMNRNLGSVHINEAQNNPLQPDVQFRGYTASPLLGLPQGLAVYQNGARINEPLGDAVNWDLIPQSAIDNITLVGGANPLFGLNTLGGALAVQMKNGFNFQGHALEASGGSFERVTFSAESGGNDGAFGYYANVHYFDEDGWRDLSQSDATNVWASVSWRREGSSADLSVAYGDSELTGNGPLPAGLLALDRSAIFTAPDITENDMQMAILEGSHLFTDRVQFAGNAFYRANDTDSFNGDVSEFEECAFFGGQQALLEGLEEDVVEDLGLDLGTLCDGSNAAIANAGDLENVLNMTAMALGDDTEFEIDDLADELSGTGVLEHEAINNISARSQNSYGTNLQMTFLQDLFGRTNQMVFGFAYFSGDSDFDAVLELAQFDANRSSAGLGTGTFVDAEATQVNTTTGSWSVFFTDTIDVTDRLAFTLSGRYNDTDVKIRDRSGERPELNGSHNFSRFNPAVGLTFAFNEVTTLYGGYGESARAPTPIELSCNDAIFAEAQRLEALAGGDPQDVDFECRLPNAFLADPPLQQVVAKSFEFGVRGMLGTSDYHLGFFHTTNQDDIIFQSTGRATGLFGNVDETLRLGFESAFSGEFGESLRWFVSYSYVAGTFGNDLEVLSPNHPFANADGVIQVRDGDTIPGIPEHQFKAGLDYMLPFGLRIGAELVANSEQYIRGDESNQLDTVDGYAIVNLRASYRINDRFQIFGRVNNLLDSNYETFGLLGEEPGAVLPDLTNQSPVFLGAGAPIGAWVGVKMTL